MTWIPRYGSRVWLAVAVACLSGCSRDCEKCNALRGGTDRRSITEPGGLAGRREPAVASDGNRGQAGGRSLGHMRGFGNVANEASEQSAEYWRRQLGDGGRAIVRPPLVIAGTLRQADLQAWYEQTIRPAALAMASRYFHRQPDKPIAILLFHDEETYRTEAARLFGDRDIGRQGYYRSHLNTIVVNADAGRSALLHELTHALMAFDLPDAPAWLREGLASLHEDCRIQVDPPHIVPLPAARQATLRRALAEGRVPSLNSLLQATSFDGRDRVVHYAIARHFCLFLDRRGRLESVYLAIRGKSGTRTDCAAVIRHALGAQSWIEVENEFLHWVTRTGQLQ